MNQAEIQLKLRPKQFFFYRKTGVPFGQNIGYRLIRGRWYAWNSMGGEFKVSEPPADIYTNYTMHSREIEDNEKT